jgi:apolipoprotein N-acyltransferase
MPTSKQSSLKQKTHTYGLLLVFIFFLIIFFPLFTFINTMDLFATKDISGLAIAGVAFALVMEIFFTLSGIYYGIQLLQGKYSLLRVIEKYLLMLIAWALIALSLISLGVLPFFPSIRSVVWYFTCGSVWYAYLARSRRLGELTGTAIRFPRLQKISEDLLLLAGGAFLFALSFPNFIFSWGLFPLAYLCLTPVFIVIARARWSLVWLDGLIFAVIATSLYAFWLVSFQALALPIIIAVYGLYFAILFLLLKLAITLFPRCGFFLQCFIWVGFEYLRTLGFTGLSYGILGYSQYLFIPLIQVASLTGVWGVSLLVVFPSALVGHSFKAGIKQGYARLKAERISLIAYSLIFLSVLAYGILSLGGRVAEKTWKVALIQPDTDPWKIGNAAYRHYLEKMFALSNDALDQDPDIVIWPETALVPSIRMHSSKRLDMDRYTSVIQPFFEYLDTKSVPFVLGNDDIELEAQDKEGARHYNAVFLMEKREIKQVYRKIHLVPFSESFPYKEIFPGIYNWLRNADTHFWYKGEEYTVFRYNDIAFATPICFEDTFGYLSREFVLRGAEVLVNLSNDAWSHSVVAEMQHMSIALFRAVENRRSLLRSTANGITCAIDPTGKIEAMLPPFKDDFLVTEVPVNSTISSLYTLWGDFWALLVGFGSLIWILIGVFKKVLIGGKKRLTKISLSTTI